MNRKQATHHEFPLVPTENTSGWLNFLRLWCERYGDAPVTSHDLLPLFWEADMPFVMLAKTRRQTFSVLNRLLWNGRGKKFRAYIYAREGEAETGRSVYRLNRLDGQDEGTGPVGSEGEK